MTFTNTYSRDQYTFASLNQIGSRGKIGSDLLRYSSELFNVVNQTHTALINYGRL